MGVSRLKSLVQQNAEGHKRLQNFKFISQNDDCDITFFFKINFKTFTKYLR